MFSCVCVKKEEEILENGKMKTLIHQPLEALTQLFKIEYVSLI